MKVTVYRDSSGRRTFFPTEGAEEEVGELADGYHVGEGIGGPSQTYVFGRPGTVGMTADRAVEVRVLVLETDLPQVRGAWIVRALRAVLTAFRAGRTRPK